MTFTLRTSVDGQAYIYIALQHRGDSIYRTVFELDQAFLHQRRVLLKLVGGKKNVHLP